MKLRYHVNFIADLELSFEFEIIFDGVLYKSNFSEVKLPNKIISPDFKFTSYNIDYKQFADEKLDKLLKKIEVFIKDKEPLLDFVITELK